MKTKKATEAIDRALAYVAETEPPITSEQVRWALVHACRNDSGAMFAMAVRIERLESALREALDWASPMSAGDFPPDSRSELKATVTRRSGVERDERLAELAKLVPR